MPHLKHALAALSMSLREGMSSEKIYRFISDPGHKENLSGRVRAACLNCRRKKTKCSGEVPCGTCEEKGIACEGLTERKRPTKNGGKRSCANSARRSSEDFASEDSNRRETLSTPRRREWTETASLSVVRQLISKNKPPPTPRIPVTRVELHLDERTQLHLRLS